MASALPPPSTITVSSLLTTTRRAEPSTSRPTSRSDEPDVGVDHLTAGDDRQVLQERLAAVAEERRLDRDGFQRLADRVDHQRRQRLALDVLGDHQQRLARLGDLLQQRQQVGQRADLVAVQQDQGVLEHGLLRVEVGDEVGRQEALVEADALGELQLGVQRRRLLDADHAVVADLGHRLADQLTDLLVARRHGGHLRDAGLAGHRGGRRQQRLGHRVGGLADTQTRARSGWRPPRRCAVRA